ncbi:LuxR C-terminal-related transcriptional regulator [Hymenobacter rubripertinctus]|uniref:HTH luxR-type domain-containing protein n=1 Tax=Hymenobacter rubripertinctus TaxID=2029981 RepID=A0A418QLX9_9BACT|nr:LuxR C-terminal-related transcriptional regulator [Hymenobacter rubripertinctus]RIY06099.1 hypothetical protein D0T11_19370 [Hymenobacter rubripertinctus]
MDSNIPSTLKFVRDTWGQIHGPEQVVMREQTIQEAARQFGRQVLKTQFLLLYKVPDLEALYCSPGVETLLGCSPAEFSFEWLYTRVHPDDATLVAEATALSARFADYLRHDVEGHVFTVDYRLLHCNGRWVRVLRQNFIVQLNETGQVVLCGSIYTDITHHKLTNDVRFLFSHPSFSAWVLNQLQPSKKERLSVREQEILSLTLQGNNSQQIADRLYLSLHTVNTHRRNINRKLGTRDLSYLLSHLDG